MKRIILMLVSITLMTIGCGTQATSTPPTNNSTSKPESSSTSPKKPTSESTTSGPTVTFVNDDGNIISLPVVGIKSTYGMNPPNPPSINPTSQIPPIHFNMPSNQSSELTAYWVNEGYENRGILFLGPRGWIPTSAGIGADGSESFVLQSPSDITQKLTVADDGACAGCALSNIAVYFPQMKQWVSQQGFSEAEQPPAFQSETQLNKNTMAYSLNSSNKGYETNGIAYMQPSGERPNTFFGHEEITMPPSEHSLETTILNFYTSYTVK